jgi:hypothetical protein
MIRLRNTFGGYCRLWLVTALLLGTLVMGGRLSAQVQQYDCGNENEQTCRVGQWERYNMRYWTENRCEFDLKPVDGICVNEKRRLLPRTGGWLGWAMQEQRYRISADEPINKVTWLASHNAFANTNQGFNSALYTNHVFSITDQLNWGVRHLELDPHYYGSAPLFFGRTDENRLCHASNSFACAVPGYGQRLLGFALDEIDTWLAENPGEVVVVKLNDKNANGPKMREEINARIGHRLVSRPSLFERWPTMREIRDTGRQILFMQHDNDPGPNPVTWNASGLVLSDNWPISQDFLSCIDSAGNSPLNQGSNSWWDVAEGRSKLNTDLFGTRTGSLSETDVRRATACGVAIIGLDFIASRGTEFDVYRPAPPSDLRHEAHIWSWRSGDFGGNASFDPQDRRWTSRPASETKRLVCSPQRTQATVNQARVWRVTTQSYTWSRLNGDAQCQAEFGTPGNPYVFAFPATGLQNRLLGEYLDSVGVTEPVWIGYTTGPEDYLSVQPSNLTFTMSVGGNPPADQQIQVLGARGAIYRLSPSQTWLSSATSPGFLPTDGSVVELPVFVNKEASELPAGTYGATLEVSLPASGSRPLVRQNVDVKLRVLAPTETIITGPSSIPLGASPELTIQVSSNPPRPINGDIELVRISPGFDEPVILQLNAGAERDVSIEGLSVGLHRFYASYLGNDELQPSESTALEITVTPRLGLSPSVAAFTIASGGSLPAQQAVQVSNLSTGATVTPLAECPWLGASFAGGSTSSISLQPLPAAGNLPAGDYACQFEVSDSLSDTLGSSTLEATLRVTTSLISVPATVPAFLVGSEPQSTLLTIATTFGESIPIRSSSTCPELRFAAENPVTVANMQILATRGDRAPGVYQCELRVESDFVVNPLVLPVTLQVVDPTVIDTNPPGLSYLVDGVAYTGRNEFTWQPGSPRQLSTTFEQAGAPGTRHRFQNWSSGPSQTQSITANANGESYVVNFATEHLLTRQSSPLEGGSSAAAPFSVDGCYPDGTVVQLSSTPASGFQATGFSGAGLTPLTNTTASILMDAPRTVTANFAAATLTPITIETNAPNATFTVDGQPQPLPVTLLLEQGRQYRFVAPGFVQEGPTAEWTFTRWVGASGSNVVDYLVTSEPATLTIDYRRSVLYNFTASPAEGGSITNNGWQLATGQLPIQAIPAEGYRFVRWTGDLAGQPNPVTLPVARPLTATAEFALLAQPTLVVMPAGPRSNGIEPDTRRVPLRLVNRGSGAAPTGRILGITNVRVLSGSGLVAAANPLPITLGSIAPGGASNFELLFQWPASATRIRFTVVFDAGDGVAAGSTTLSLFR